MRIPAEVKSGHSYSFAGSPVQEAAGLIAHCTRTTAAKIDIQPNIPTAYRADILLARAARDCRAGILQVRAAGSEMQ